MRNTAPFSKQATVSRIRNGGKGCGFRSTSPANSSIAAPTIRLEICAGSKQSPSAAG
jgi:hypothetical protein